MSERAAVEATVVCPFLAYGEERDARASVPDHRHRCFAESPAAPRALAHQAAYCLTTAFTSCPTFVDWAIREAAPARDLGPPARTLRDAPIPRAGGQPPDAAGGLPARPLAAAPSEAAPAPPVPRSSGSRTRDADWTSPPPWAPPAATAPAGRDAGVDAEPGDELLEEGAEGETGLEEPGPPAFLAGRALDDGRPAQYQPVAGPVMRRAPVGHAGLGAEQRTESERAADPAAPPWERPRRFEAYPTLRSRDEARAGGRSVPRLAVWVAIVAIAAVALFAAPFILRGLGGGGPAGSPSPSAAASVLPSVEPTPTPEPRPTPLVYTVKSGDTLSKIAAAYKVSVDQILEANPEITNPNKIKAGDRITIPVPLPGEIVNPTGDITPAP